MNFRSFCSAAVIATCLTTVSHSAQADDIDVLLDALRIDDTVQIMREEGLVYGAELGAEMLPDVSEDRWQSIVSRIYDPAKMEVLITSEFEASLADVNLEPLVAFFTSDLGVQIIELELSAREAFLDTAAEEAAMDAFEKARADDALLYRQVDGIITDSDLVEFNVMGAMNANLNFYRGLSEGGAIEMAEDEMLAEVWAQEEDIRADSEEWLGSFLTLAYAPLSEDDLDAYAALYRTPEGQDLNTAIFEAYDRMYDEISYLLGQAVANELQGEDL